MRGWEVRLTEAGGRGRGRRPVNSVLCPPGICATLLLGCALVLACRSEEALPRESPIASAAPVQSKAPVPPAPTHASKILALHPPPRPSGSSNQPSGNPPHELELHSYGTGRDVFLGSPISMIGFRVVNHGPVPVDRYGFDVRFTTKPETPCPNTSLPLVGSSSPCVCAEVEDPSYAYYCEVDNSDMRRSDHIDGCALTRCKNVPNFQISFRRLEFIDGTVWEGASDFQSIQWPAPVR